MRFLGDEMVGGDEKGKRWQGMKVEMNRKVMVLAAAAAGLDG